MVSSKLISSSYLDLFLKRFDQKVIPKLKSDKIKIAKHIVQKYKIPKRYLEGLNADEKFLRQLEIISKKRQTPKERFTPLKSDVIAREKGIPKKGSCTERWERMYPGAKSNAQKSKITGIPKDILDKVDHKGQGAFYSSGSRPGQNALSWGKARVNCFLLNKKTVTQGPDKNLFEDSIRRSPKSKKWFQKTKFD
jgi:hypothetical protein